MQNKLEVHTLVLYQQLLQEENKNQVPFCSNLQRNLLFHNHRTTGYHCLRYKTELFTLAFLWKFKCKASQHNCWSLREESVLLLR